ncbi:hypothetical protein PUR57_05345 [Streptomyces sp. JV176]|uniref:hypothetical protein n=1 Tax=Streptomyces sp. JV176 TaxID=858630 RepID=UPI002E7A1864|nr:hypothetical protein [Streptomyces sp. JV176]MEE1798107.1 hypothetical protein [Streptomyces sp. JV176]
MDWLDALLAQAALVSVPYTQGDIDAAEARLAGRMYAGIGYTEFSAGLAHDHDLTFRGSVEQGDGVQQVVGFDCDRIREAAEAARTWHLHRTPSASFPLARLTVTLERYAAALKLFVEWRCEQVELNGAHWRKCREAIERTDEAVSAVLRQEGGPTERAFWLATVVNSLLVLTSAPLPKQQ